MPDDWKTDTQIDIVKLLDKALNKPTVHVDGDLVANKTVDLSNSVFVDSPVGGMEAPGTTFKREGSIMVGPNLPSTMEVMTSRLNGETMTPERSEVGPLQVPTAPSAEEGGPDAQAVKGGTGVEFCPSCGNAVRLEQEACCSICGKFI